MDEQLNKIIGLIRQTGDKCIVLEESGEAYVVMTLKDYEKLILGRSEVRDLTEEELLDKMNRDIAVWRASQEQEDEKDLEDVLAEQFCPPVGGEKPAEPENSVEKEAVGENQYYFEPLT